MQSFKAITGGYFQFADGDTFPRALNITLPIPVGNLYHTMLVIGLHYGNDVTGSNVSNLLSSTSLSYTSGTAAMGPQTYYNTITPGLGVLMRPYMDPVHGVGTITVNCNYSTYPCHLGLSWTFYSNVLVTPSGTKGRRLDNTNSDYALNPDLPLRFSDAWVTTMTTKIGTAPSYGTPGTPYAYSTCYPGYHLSTYVNYPYASSSPYPGSVQMYQGYMCPLTMGGTSVVPGCWTYDPAPNYEVVPINGLSNLYVVGLTMWIQGGFYIPNQTKYRVYSQQDLDNYELLTKGN